MKLNDFNKLNTRKLTAAAILATGFLSLGEPAFARDPACANGDQGVCDMLGSMILAKGRGCHRMMSVTPLGNNAWRINCVVSSTSDARATYTLRFNADRTSYTLN
ncbi:hypothetical protein [Cochlodiniinecator piscidefendens]|uniref:hypothetical protein n=1 Tax=Cochlodiniinecator piscidefendens TaxID=2715756 RepID=UPI00197C58F5|nr:hypothetical protein [Cochlodiniinecator piscidefendens]